MDYKNVNDYEVLYMVKDNNDEYFTLLIDKYKPIMISMVKNYLPIVKKHGLEFDDLLQECYISLLDSVKTFDEHNDVKFYTYVCFCMHRRLITVCRNVNTKKNSVLSDSDFDFSMDIIEDRNSDINGIMSFNDLHKKLRSFLNSFDIIDSAILELKINGFSYNEISILLDVSLRFVQSRLYILRRNLKFEFNKYY